ncbi:thioredoxin family protein [Polyangium spumosum]|uniref:Redoxin family protein n=1 Tax=Polyangium spumosum TaxID=889282 RepID=A0A6N7Q097_9BACT|nr:thioredoxin family protein [Polyangium spumosum]MRG96566.1 redoxin family protein [Polyangium spumosum]
MSLRPLLVLPLLLLACNKETPSPAPEAKAPDAKTPTAAASDKPAAAAEIGKPAPDFTLTDDEGKSHHLADYRGKTVVLEWFNAGCPFVKASHTKGSLKGLSKRAAEKGVVWLAINSSAPGKQGHGAESVAEGRKAFGFENPVLVDASGKVGKMYGATNTPHMYVIDAQGTLVYRGAIDNSPDGEGESPKDGKLVNHVEEALDDLAAGKPVRTPETKAYGCGVKYGS